MCCSARDPALPKGHWLSHDNALSQHPNRHLQDTPEYLSIQDVNYKNPKTKIQRMVKNKEIFPITKGLYETIEHINPFYLADPIYSPSYISFDSALAYYDLIPEAIYVVSSATYDKKKSKIYTTPFGRFIYRDIPKGAFAFGVNIISENGYTYRIALKEKALLDKLYTIKPVKNMKEMKELLFEDLRIDEYLFMELDFEFIIEIASLYHSNTLLTLKKYIKKIKMS